VVRSRAGQALVEFALVAPIVLLIIGATVDLGRGLLLFSLLSGASRDVARQATLEYNKGSNSLPPDCTALATPCSLNSVLAGAHLLDTLGVQVMYADSSPPITSMPGYGSFSVAPTTTQPGTIVLPVGAAANTVFVFIYELDSTAGNPNPRFSCPTCADPTGRAVRTSGHQLVVVDLKLKWRPVLATFLGIPAAITFDAQTVDRLEF
jgi:TadE-like protein